MRYKHELVQDCKIAVFDNGKTKHHTYDRYTVIFFDCPENQPSTFACVGMSAAPFHPQGFGQHSSAMPGKHLGKRIAFAALPADCRKLVEQDLNEIKKP